MPLTPLEIAAGGLENPCRSSVVMSIGVRRCRVTTDSAYNRQEPAIGLGQGTLAEISS